MTNKNKDDLIVKAATRLADKLRSSKYLKLNGEYPKSVKVEIDRLKNHCRVELCQSKEAPTAPEQS